MIETIGLHKTEHYIEEPLVFSIVKQDSGHYKYKDISVLNDRTIQIQITVKAHDSTATLDLFDTQWHRLIELNGEEVCTLLKDVHKMYTFATADNKLHDKIELECKLMEVFDKQRNHLINTLAYILDV